MAEKKRKAKVGLALGGGAARGAAHLGVLEVLAEDGIYPDIICGTSIGSLVAASYISGKLAELKEWALQLTWHDMLGLMDVRLTTGGIVSGRTLMEHLTRFIDDKDIEDLDCAYGSVATNLKTGREHWFNSGSLLSSVRASISLPGLFTPYFHNDHWFVDGGLVNPVPVSLCRALGADVVIAVNLNGDILGKHLVAGQEHDDKELGNSLLERISSHIPNSRNSGEKEPELPSLFSTMASSINIMQDRITRSRMAGEPPDVTIVPHLAHLSLLDFEQAKQAIDEGRRSTQLRLGEIQEYIVRNG